MSEKLNVIDPKAWFRARVPPSANGLWIVLHELAGEPEQVLRATLRSHEDSGLNQQRDERIMRQREQLDEALDALTLLEVGYETGFVTEADLPIPEFRILTKLFRSEAFFRYVSVYQYFGVRFLAARVLNVPWTLKPPADEHDSLWRNERGLPLRIPPVIELERSLQLATIAVWDHQLHLMKSSEAFGFLDGFFEPGDPANFELWLRGLRPDLPETKASRFAAVAKEMQEWAAGQAMFLLSLHPDTPFGSEVKGLPEPPSSGQHIHHPFVARYTLSVIYWVAGLLRMEIDSDAKVLSRQGSWLGLLSFHAELLGDHASALQIRRAENVLRAALAMTCDLIQNATELTAEQEETFSTKENQRWDRPATTCKSREVLDKEARAIFDQRRMRHVQSAIGTTGETLTAGPAPGCTDGWSERFTTGFMLSDVVGLAFSGGGIRSATFNLGVLQGLQELDLLSSVDYLSTVSGGGFIGSWLVANVKRSHHWMARKTNWGESLAHLRAYAN